VFGFDFTGVTMDAHKDKSRLVYTSLFLLVCNIRLLVAVKPYFMRVSEFAVMNIRTNNKGHPFGAFTQGFMKKLV